LEKAGVTDPEAQRRAVIDWYLDAKHRDQPDDSCPLTVFTQEAPRLGPKPRQVIGRMVQRFGQWMSRGQKEDKGLVALSLMVGAITLSRAVEDTEISDKILKDAKAQLHDMIGPQE
jgi:TetR/AcrR family transcriptional repressor of nem operon